MIRVKTSDVRSVASCYGGQSVTIAVNEGEPIVISGSAADVQAMGQRIVDASKKSANPEDTGLALMEGGPR